LLAAVLMRTPSSEKDETGIAIKEEKQPVAAP
jgi:hypothetical protein